MSKTINVNDVTRFCDLIALGTTAAEAAAIVGRSVSALGNAARDTWPELYEEAQLKRADFIRNRIWAKFMQDSDAATMRWAGDHLVKWYVPEARDKLEISGDPDKPIIVTHQRGLTLADLLADPRAARLVEQARRELPDAGELLAESE